MNKTLLSLLALTFAACAFAAGKDFTVRRYNEPPAMDKLRSALDTCSSAAAQLEVARRFQSEYPAVVPVQMLTANVLLDDGIEKVKSYYEERAQANPANLEAQYLAGRMQEDPVRRKEYADRILSRNPADYWGHVLLSGTFTETEDPDLSKSEAELRSAVDIDNSLPFAVEELGKLLASKGDTAQADVAFTKLGQILPGRFDPLRYRILLNPADHQRTLRLTGEFLKETPQNIDALYARAGAQRELSDWSGYVESMQRAMAAEANGNNAYNLACAYSLAGMTDSAFASLFRAVDLEFNDVEQYKSDDDLIPLRNDARWTELLDKTEAADKARLTAYLEKARANAPQRKQEALGERMSMPAPDFELKDLNGKTVKLSALRGKVVILDFWATWCGPCKRTMPLVNQFYTESKPDNVEVFGVNVWERGSTDGVKPFIEKFGYKFPVLYGTNDLASSYGVRGIPTLFMIDQKGNIAYRHVGYTPTMAEELSWQVNELLK